jgi:hypothetical protein
VKYAIFRRDPRAELLIDDCTGFRAVLAPATVEVREHIAAELPRFRAIRESTRWPYRTTLSICEPWPPGDGSCWPSRRTSPLGLDLLGLD